LIRHNVIVTFCVLFTILGFASPVYADSSAEAVISPEAAAQVAKKNDLFEQLSELRASIEGARQELAEVKVALKNTKDELDTKALIEQRDKLSSRIQTLQKNFESVAIGGVDVDAFEQKVTKRFDWQEEIKEVFRPILDEMKRLTERPRTIERLRSEKTFLESRLPIADNALEKIKALQSEADNNSLNNHLQKLEQNWQKRRDDIDNQLSLVSFQLEEKLNPPEESRVSVAEQLKDLLTGRGLNIVYGIIAFFLVYFIFRLISRVLVHFIDEKRNEETRLFEKAIIILFRVLAVLLAVFAVVIVFYVQGDWILLGLSLLFLIGFAWTLRQSLPRFVAEAKLLLNLGSVRENERVVFNGIPYQVTALNFYSTLTNPALAGGILKLPTQVILELQSRRFAKDELWFPCRRGDFMMLDDGYFGPVLMQTPEVVAMKVRGGSTKTYATTDFLAQNPKNLSHGFGVFVVFGFDYADQALITSEILCKLKAFIEEAMVNEPYFPFIRELRVEFNEAAASSLNVVIIATFEGKAAEYYYPIRRFMQLTTVNACNHHGWNIPFNQMTVHLANKE